MAIQTVDLKVPNGDTPRSANTKINANFSNTTHAASRLVGLFSENIPDGSNIRNSYLRNIGQVRADANTNLDVFAAGERGNIDHANTSITSDKYGATYFTVETLGTTAGVRFQIAYESSNAQASDILVRRKYSSNDWSEWRPFGQSRHTYVSTTATAANVTVDSSGVLRRASSSEKYKDILADLELDDEAYSNAMQVKPIIYRSKSDADPQDWHFLSFSAEKLGELDPALTQWKTHETDPETGEQVELEQKEAEGINLNAICAVLHATNVYQDKKIKELEQRLTVLESANEPIE